MEGEEVEWDTGEEGREWRVKLGQVGGRGAEGERWSEKLDQVNREREREKKKEKKEKKREKKRVKYCSGVRKGGSKARALTRRVKLGNPGGKLAL